MTSQPIGTREHPPQGAAKIGGSQPYPNGISYHGGPIITAGTHIYYVWYGNWSGDPATSILTTLGNSIGGSPYFNINTTYFNGAGVHVLNSVLLSGQTGATSANYKYGTALTDANVQSIVSDALSSGVVPPDAQGVYFVLTSADVHETSGFCTKYCGWHTHYQWNGHDIKYAFVGDADKQCPSACEEQTTTSPNGDPGADGMASVIAHELEEATTDPDLNAWYDQRGYENADKCAWTFGTTYPAGNGSIANMSLGGSNFLIQQNWVNASGGYCALSY